MKKILLLVLITISSVACSVEDDKPTTLLDGTWFLTQIECFCGFDPDIDFEDFTLRFEADKNTVHIDNPTEDYFYISRSGSYDYAVENNILSVEEAEPYIYEIRGSTLILTRIDDPAIADDELVLYYQKR